MAVVVEHFRARVLDELARAGRRGVPIANRRNILLEIVIGELGRLVESGTIVPLPLYLEDLRVAVDLAIAADIELIDAQYIVLARLFDVPLLLDHAALRPVVPQLRGLKTIWVDDLDIA